MYIKDMNGVVKVKHLNQKDDWKLCKKYQNKEGSVSLKSIFKFEVLNQNKYGFMPKVLIQNGPLSDGDETLLLKSISLLQIAKQIQLLITFAT